MVWPICSRAPSWAKGVVGVSDFDVVGCSDAARTSFRIAGLATVSAQQADHVAALRRSERVRATSDVRVAARELAVLAASANNVQNCGVQQCRPLSVKRR